MAKVEGNTKAQPRPKRFKVRATQDGFHDNKLRRTGDVFVVNEEHLSKKWMEPAPDDAPLKQSTNSDVIRRKHDETLGGQRLSGAGSSEETTADDGGTGDADPLGGDQ